MNYLELRKAVIMPGFYVLFAAMIFTVALGKDVFFCFIGIFVFASFIAKMFEVFLYRCPACSKKPLKFFEKFPETCSFCGKKLGEL